MMDTSQVSGQAKDTIGSFGSKAVGQVEYSSLSDSRFCAFFYALPSSGLVRADCSRIDYLP